MFEFTLARGPGSARRPYLEIVEALAQRIGDGRLAPGTRLPTQRALAAQLGISVATANRAYIEAALRGMIVSHVGRGTFVTMRGQSEATNDRSSDARYVDLTTNWLSFEDRVAPHFQLVVEALLADANLRKLMRYQPGPGSQRHREAGCRWLAKVGVTAEPADVVVCNGLQHGISLILSTLSEPGDVVLTEELNYPGVRLLDQIHPVRIRGVAIDAEGLDPYALEAACKDGGARFLLCTPFVHNPTNAVMSGERRRHIAAIAERHDLCVIECDNNEIPPTRPLRPVGELVPARAFYVSSTWRVTGFGICVGFVHVPGGLVTRLATAVQASTWMTSPLQMELFSALIDDGTTERILTWHREENRRRLELARSILGRYEIGVHHASPNVWIPLPDPWRTEEFARQAAAAGVLVRSSDAFVIGRAAAPHAVRVSLGGVSDLGRLDRGLRTLDQLLSAHPTHPHINL